MRKINVRKTTANVKHLKNNTQMIIIKKNIYKGQLLKLLEIKSHGKGIAPALDPSTILQISAYLSNQNIINTDQFLENKTGIRSKVGNKQFFGKGKILYIC